MGIQRNLTLLAILAATAATPAAAQNWDWAGGRAGAPMIRLVGAGVPALYPQLRRSNRGRAFVMRNFDRNRDGRIQPVEAREANAAFEILAGARRDRFDWEARDVALVRERPGRWDRAAMQGYGFRQTPRGAMMSLSEEVLFATDSAVLRPGAIRRLEPLADYLRGNPGVRVAIDGHTDSRGTDAHNQGLSLRRADAVRAAFDEMGVTRARFSVQGYGERQPVASNATPQGMRQNRRVEVTLLGRRASEFAAR
ncbi:OmpA family protein [Sphingomonas sp. Y38-1Y]|uniref:OmpA family protein n=1 Tax=Sphingomonas sp. Y38-1Y TaxID=3078265 RepID=UPI0028EDEBA3|nr:OmpA family protein [Sphingomonas sp. Y38-1Y]